MGKLKMNTTLRIFPLLALLPVIAMLLIMAEVIWNWRTRRGVYSFKETLANLAILVGFSITKRLLRGYHLFWLGLAGNWVGTSLSRNGGTFLLAFVLTDFMYYWHHRISHEIQFFWAFHVVHHSARHFNLTASYRLNWFGGLVSVFFYLPLIMLGLPPAFVASSMALNLFYQFFLHTEAVGRLGALEGILNTPSAHRVHHGSNEIYLDKNYGGVLMIWDRIFGTYEPEGEKAVYGITTGFVSYNPFMLVLHGFVDFVRARMHYRG